MRWALADAGDGMDDANFETRPKHIPTKSVLLGPALLHVFEKGMPLASVGVNNFFAAACLSFGMFSTQAIAEYSSDAMRWALADAGDGVHHANTVVHVTNVLYMSTFHAGYRGVQF
jgi:hypothetical protein